MKQPTPKEVAQKLLNDLEGRSPDDRKQAAESLLSRAMQKHQEMFEAKWGKNA
jgi:hypothetical protein